MRLLKDCRLYGILDLSYISTAEAVRFAQQMIEGGVDILQLRAKNQPLPKIVDLARELHAITCPASTPLIVNDHPEVAKQVAVEGVHVGQDDIPIAQVREATGREIIVGKSTHSLEQARTAVSEGADYIGCGPIFATPTKPDYKPVGLGLIKPVHAEVELPIFCIGGINIDNLQRVMDAGAKRVVMVSALLRARSVIDYARCATDMLA